MVSQLEGLIPALETAHAFSFLFKLAPTLPSNQHIVVCVSGRGDKGRLMINNRCKPS